MSVYKERLKQYQEVLNEDVIDLDKLRKLCINGIPEQYRPLCWKLLLGYLPVEKSQWDSTQLRNRTAYMRLIEEFICQREVGPKSSSLDDHPLNPNPESRWKNYFRDNEILRQINEDSKRLCPDFNFFQQATEFPCRLVMETPGVESFRDRIEHTTLNAASVTRTIHGTTKIHALLKPSKEVADYKRLPKGQEAHWEVVERLLFLYAKLNPGLGYVQGMNEIMGPLYYVFATDFDNENREHAEADTFFCYTTLMGEIRDVFVKSLDDSAHGVNATLARYVSRLRKVDPALSQLLREQDLNPMFYAFRWITLILSQEFPLPDVIRLWDALFADSQWFDFLIWVCCSMMVLIRDTLMTGDFPSNMKLLQHYPVNDVNLIISKALQLSRS